MAQDQLKFSFSGRVGSSEQLGGDRTQWAQTPEGASIGIAVRNPGPTQPGRIWFAASLQDWSRPKWTVNLRLGSSIEFAHGGNR